MNIYEKLLAVQSELKAPKNQYNSFGNYKYRNCEDILEAAKPLAHKVNALIILSDEVKMLNDRYYVEATATFIDCESGEKMSVTASAREEATKKGMDGSQITGASSSYARKYALGGLLDIDDNKDSDSTNKHGKDDTPKRKEETPKYTEAEIFKCEACGDTLRDVTKRDGELWPVAEIAAYSKRRFEKCLCPDCMKVALSKEKEHENN